MTVNRMAAKLRIAHANAPKGEVCASVILFAIEHAQYLRRHVSEVRKQSRIPEGYSNELYSGIKLAKYVKKR